MNKSDFYREVRGVMTRFDPVSEADLAENTMDGLTLSELHDVLAEFGLEVRFIVRDPSRKNFGTCYADYERGLYCSLLLSRQFLLGPGRHVLKAMVESGEEIRRVLEEKNWLTYYSKYVPMSMHIYDFQRRYMDIQPDEVFSVWFRLHKNIDVSSNMWPLDVLKYVFDHAPPAVLPERDAEGLITIYRGMGEFSLPPEQAISWSTHPGNALWFAIHSGRGVKMATARIRPEQVVAYYPKFYNENEVIVRPGSVLDYRYEDMIPATQEDVPPLLAPVLPAYIRYGRQTQKLGYKVENPFGIHGILHILRVLLLSLIYYYNSGDTLSERDLQILIYFSLLHDIGRTNDDLDNDHGEKSAAYIRKKGIRLQGIRLSKKEYRIAELLIVHHCHNDEVGEAAILSEPGLSRREKEHAVHLYRICKDMDGLDRVRFNGLDYRMLRTEYGRKLPLVAGCLLEEDLLQALEFDL